MNCFFLSRRLVLSSLIVAGATAVHFTSRACSPARSNVVWSGPLGFESGYGNGAIVPRNLAVLMPAAVFDADGGMPRTWELDPVNEWSTPTTPFDADEPLQFGAIEVRTGAFIDTSAPTMPTIYAASASEPSGGGCIRSRCGAGGVSLRVQLVVSTDDHARSGSLTYVVYTGGTAEEAETTATVYTRLLAPVGVLESAGLAAPRAYIAVAAADQAGNLSPRSGSFRLHR